MQSQIMKKNKIKSLMLTGVLAASMAVPVFAANITIDGTGAEFQAYKLLNLTTSAKECELEEGPDHTHGPACQYNYSYTINGTYDAALKAVTHKESQEDIIKYIEDLKGDSVRAFADAMYAQVRAMPADDTANNKVFSDVQQGYYLIVGTKKAELAITATVIPCPSS